ncbi:DUF2846 domain-containing protein [uncultured Desulfuromonas sp.]|uniref:DUF2846 domain-containing protein n=1 Tax=uncultured Desulfuromonas sp. TaxID=181013 RepID=UPI002AAAC9EF|nr:DUF2846 domain-containing protein [uncultured Desulfuromonas sp.]
MRKSILLLILTLSVVSVSLLSGCATLGPKFTEPVMVPAKQAVIYVYRPRWGTTGDEMPGIKMNDKVIANTLPQLGYFPIAVTPGQYTFTPKLIGIYKTTPVTVNAKAGQVYYVELQVKIGHLQFALADPDKAKAYMTTCYRIDPKFAEDSRIIFDDPVSQSTPATTQTQTDKSAVKTKQPAKAVVKTARLYVKPTPSNARIRIMNIRPKFEQGITLNSGRYHIDVSAAGYESYSKWITLKAGEIRSMSVNLKAQETKTTATKAVKKAPQKAIAAPVHIKPVKAPANLSGEQKRIAKLLQSDSAIDVRNGAKNVYYHHSNSPYLAQVAEQTLLREYQKETSDRNEIDALAWLCKALAQTHDSRFSKTLHAVSEDAYHRKVRSYAAKSLSQL